MPLVKGKLINPNKYLITAEQNQTRGTRNPKTGQMTGRTNTQKGDGTRNIRARQDIDIDGKPGIGKQDIHGGQIMGRLARGESKPTKIRVESHYRNGKYVGHYIRKVHD